MIDSRQRDEIATFAEQGFARIEQLIDHAAVSEVRSYYDRVIEREIDCGEDYRLLGGLTRQVMHTNKHHPFFRDNPALDAGRALAREILGVEDPPFFFDMLITKPPGTPHATPWHQDAAYAQMPFAPAGTELGIDFLQFWVALDDADTSNGCMQFIPGSHLGGLRQHYVFSGEPDYEGRLLATDDVDPSLAVACPVAAGGCTIHTSGTLHYTGPNVTTDRPRRAYIFNFGRPVAPTGSR